MELTALQLSLGRPTVFFLTLWRITDQIHQHRVTINLWPRLFVFILLLVFLRVIIRLRCELMMMTRRMQNIWPRNFIDPRITRPHGKFLLLRIYLSNSIFMQRYYLSGMMSTYSNPPIYQIISYTYLSIKLGQLSQTSFRMVISMASHPHSGAETQG